MERKVDPIFIEAVKDHVEIIEGGTCKECPEAEGCTIYKAYLGDEAALNELADRYNAWVKA